MKSAQVIGDEDATSTLANERTTSEFRRPARARFASLVGIGIGIVYLVMALAFQPAYKVDLAVYQEAVGQLLTGGSLYSSGSFLYPPFAGLILLPAGLLPSPGPAVINLAVHLVACIVLALVLLGTAPSRRRDRVDTVLTFLLCVLALLASNAVVIGLYFGQVSLAVVTLMVVDQFLGPRWRGLLTGVAGGIKLIPLIMIPHYLLTRQWRAAANSVGGFAAATTLGVLFAPADSLRYWSGAVPMPVVVDQFNKSLSGLMHHWGSSDLRVWLVGAVVIGAAALWRAGQHHRAGEGLAAVLVLGLASSLVSPLSWMHHLVWWPLAGLYLVLAGNRWQRLLGWLMISAILSGSPLVPYTAWLPPAFDVLGDVFTVGSAILVFTGLPRHAGEGPVP